MYIKVRSFALATFLVGRGFAPIDTVLIDGRPVFRFGPDVDDSIDDYNVAKAKLEALTRSAKPVEKAQP